MTDEELHERDALKFIVENQQKIIAVMDYQLLLLGVVFNYQTAIEEWKRLEHLKELQRK